MRYQSKSFLSASSQEQTKLLIKLAGTCDQRAVEAQALLERNRLFVEPGTALAKDRLLDWYLWFCKGRRIDPWSGDPETIAAWLYKSSRKHVRTTISTRAATLADAFARQGLPDPTRSPLVVETLDAILDTAPQRRRSHDILLVDDFRALKSTQSLDSLAGLRNVVIFGLAYVAMFRPESILRLRTCDVSVSGGMVTVHSEYKRVSLLTRIRSEEGDGLVEHLAEYLERADLGDGLLFRSISNGRIPEGAKALTKSRLDVLFKDALVNAGYVPFRYCFQSLRFGYLYAGYLEERVSKTELSKRAGYDTVGSFFRAMSDIETGTGGYCVPNSKTPPPRTSMSLFEGDR